MAPSTSRRLLIPREHGAYAELLFPVTTGLALAGLAWPAWALALAVTAGFVSHESALILAGVRGSRIRQEEGPRARRWLTILAGATLLLGGLGFWGSSAEGRIALLAPIGSGIALIPFIHRRMEKSLAGELIVIAGLSSTVVPIALAGGTELRIAMVAAVAWFAVFSTGTLAVLAVKARNRRGVRGRWPLLIAPLYGLAVLGLGYGLVERGVLAVPVVVATLLSVAAAVAVAILPIPVRRLRRVGWTFAGTSIVTWLGLVIGLD